MADQLVTLCAALKRNARAEFDRFHAEFQRYTVKMALEVGNCPPEKLGNYAGRIAQCNAILQIFNECDREAPKSAPHNAVRTPEELLKWLPVKS